MAFEQFQHRPDENPKGPEQVAGEFARRLQEGDAALRCLSGEQDVPVPATMEDLVVSLREMGFRARETMRVLDPAARFGSTFRNMTSRLDEFVSSLNDAELQHLRTMMVDGSLKDRESEVLKRLLSRSD